MSWARRLGLCRSNDPQRHFKAHKIGICATPTSSITVGHFSSPAISYDPKVAACAISFLLLFIAVSSRVRQLQAELSHAKCTADRQLPLEWSVMQLPLRVLMSSCNAGQFSNLIKEPFAWQRFAAFVFCNVSPRFYSSTG